MAKKLEVTWADAPAEHDYPAAAAYLRLVASATLTDVLTSLLAEATTEHHRVKDILRASRLPLLPADDPEVAKALKKVAKGTPLSPILLVIGDITSDRRLQIADGYHRVCASYHVDEDTEVPCRLVDIPLVAIWTPS